MDSIWMSPLSALASMDGWIARLSSAGLISVRLATALWLSPLLPAHGMPVRARLILVLVLSLTLGLALPRDAHIVPLGASQWVASAMMEVANGLALALGLASSVLAFEMAGRWLDTQIGFGMNQVMDPSTRHAQSVLSAAMRLAGVMLFWTLDVHHAVLRALAGSLEWAPVGVVFQGWADIRHAVDAISSLFAWALALSAPVLGGLLLTEVALGVFSKALPQMNVLAVGMGVKVLIGIMLTAAWVPFLAARAPQVFKGSLTLWEGLIGG